MPIYAIEQLIPVIDPSAFIHPSSEIIGDVIIQAHCYIGPNAVLRGDFGRIIVKANSNVQDNCVLHSFPNKDCILEPYSHIGHGAILHGCLIGEHALIGMNSVIMDEAIIGPQSIVAANSFVKSKFQCEPRSMLVGSPAKVLRAVTDEEFAWKAQGTQQYVDLAHRCHQSLREVAPLTSVQPQRPRYDDSKHQPKS